MTTITINVPADKAKRVADAFKGLWPIPVDEEGKATFTDSAWVKEKLVGFIKATVLRHEQVQAMNTAKETVSIDDTLVSTE